MGQGRPFNSRVGMTKKFEQFSLFEDKNSSPSSLSPKKKPFTPFPNILLECLSDHQVRNNSVYYLRVINKLAQKRFSNPPFVSAKKVFFSSLLNELALKKGYKTPLTSCRSAVLLQSLTSFQKK